jgi:phage shock protein A
MSLWQRIKLVLSSNINSLISKAEDPEKILEQLIIEMRNQFAEAKKQVASSIADEKRLERQFQEEQKGAQEWEQKAMLAVRAGNDELARKALTRKKEHDTRSEEFKTQYLQQKAAADQLRTALKQLNDKIEEARRKKNLLIARSKRAEAQRKIHDTMSSVGDTAAFDTFDRMAAKVEQIEAEAAASVELTAHMSGDNLSEEFKKLEASGAGGDDALLALKARMGLTPDPVAKGALPEPTPVDDELEALKALVSGSTPASIDLELEEAVTVPSKA